MENAREDLFEGATWYLTPPAGARWLAAGASSPADAAPWAVERLRGLIERIGARPVAIDPDAHDRLMASVSHLPHVLANVLVAQTAGAIESGGRRGTGRRAWRWPELSRRHARGGGKHCDMD